MRVLVGGVFDILHPGHIFFLKKAAGCGEELVVVVATDETAKKNKKRDPVFNQSERVLLVESLDMVTNAIPGQTADYLYAVKQQKPDVIVLGHDQKFPSLEKDLEKEGLNVKVIRLTEKLPGYSTTSMLGRIED